MCTRELIFFCFFFLVLQNITSSSFSYRIWELSPTLKWLDYHSSVNQSSAWCYWPQQAPPLQGFHNKQVDWIDQWTQWITGWFHEATRSPMILLILRYHISYDISYDIDLLWYFQSWSDWRVMLVLYRQSSNLPDFTQGPFLFGHIYHKYVFGCVVFVCVCVCGGGQDFVGLRYHILYYSIHSKWKLNMMSGKKM